MQEVLEFAIRELQAGIRGIFEEFYDEEGFLDTLRIELELGSREEGAPVVTLPASARAKQTAAFIMAAVHDLSGLNLMKGEDPLLKVNIAYAAWEVFDEDPERIFGQFAEQVIHGCRDVRKSEVQKKLNRAGSRRPYWIHVTRRYEYSIPVKAESGEKALRKWKEGGGLEAGAELEFLRGSYQKLSVTLEQDTPRRTVLMENETVY